MTHPSCGIHRLFGCVFCFFFTIGYTILFVELPGMKVYKMKERKGVVERMVDDYTIIGRSVKRLRS